MLTRLLHLIIGRLERRLGVSLDYLRELVRASGPAFLKLLLIGPISQHRQRLPRPAFHVARIAATQAEDCGTCLEIVLHYARRDGLDARFLTAAVRRDPDELPADLQTVMQFATTVAGGDDDPLLRANLRRRYGDAAVVELALAIATARVFPTLKRALGHATACSRPS